jgi:hypothetical protein
MEPQQEIGEAQDGTGRLAPAPEDRLRQRVIGAVREGIAVDDQEGRMLALRARAFALGCSFDRAMAKNLRAYPRRVTAPRAAPRHCGQNHTDRIWQDALLACSRLERFPASCPARSVCSISSKRSGAIGGR